MSIFIVKLVNGKLLHCIIADLLKEWNLSRLREFNGVVCRSANLLLSEMGINWVNVVVKENVFFLLE